MFAKPNRHLKATAAAASVLALLAGAPSAALACGQDAYVGSVCTVAFNFCPEGTLAAQGQLLPINQYQVLYSLLGTMYGGNGSTTFALPDLRGRTVVGAGQGAGLTNVLLGQQRGAEGATLTANQLAAHTHPAVFTGTGDGAAGGTASGPVSLNVSGSTASAAVTGTVTANAISNQGTGGSGTPSASANTVGKNGLTPMYYPYSSATAVGSPTTISLTAPSTAINGTAAGTISLPVTGGITGGTVAVGGNATQNTPVPVLDPGLGMTVCIVTQGIYPQRP